MSRREKILICWDNFAICLKIACEETSLQYNLYGGTLRVVLAVIDLKLRPKCTQHTST